MGWWGWSYVLVGGCLLSPGYVTAGEWLVWPWPGALYLFSASLGPCKPSHYLTLQLESIITSNPQAEDIFLDDLK